jgi:hypothetical protein
MKVMFLRITSILAFVWFATSAAAQSATTTTVTASSNPVGLNEGVSFTATISGSITYDVRFPIGAPIGQSGFGIVRYELIGGTFAIPVSTAGFTNVTALGTLQPVSILQGGGVGQTYVVLQVNPALPRGLLATDVFSLLLPSVTAPANTTPSIQYSLHQTLSSATGPVASNTALLSSPPALPLISFLTSNSITGTVSFRDGGVVIPGCSAAAVSSGSAVCSTTFGSLGSRIITAIYSGDTNFLTSTGTLAGGITVGLPVLPAGLASATVNVTYTGNFNSSSGTAPYTFSIGSGTLPPGIFLGSAGTITGTPTTAGSYSFSVNVQDASGNTGSRTYNLQVVKGTQVITFDPGAFGNVGVPITLNGSSSSGLPVSYSATPSSVCRVSGSVLTPLNVGTCRIIASQPGDGNYQPANDVDRNLSILAPGAVKAIRIRSAAGVSMAGRLTGNQLVFSVENDPGAGFRLVSNSDIDGNGADDLVYQNTTQGEFGEVRVWRDYNSADDRLLRNLKLTWRLEASGDLDGDGRGDLVWRFTGQSPNIDDTGVSYIWFTNGSDVTQVRKRGGAPLSWRLLGAVDVNKDRAADMIYLSPDRQLRVLVATANRTCANFSGGQIPFGYSALAVGDFTGNKLGEIFVRDTATGQNRIVVLDGTSVTLPTPTANPDDPNAACTPTTQVVSNSLRTYFAADVTWQFFAAADLDGDGIKDIVWLKPNGSLAVWLMSRDAGVPAVIDNAGTLPSGFTVVLQ